jgi:AbiU2
LPRGVSVAAAITITLSDVGHFGEDVPVSSFGWQSTPKGECMTPDQRDAGEIHDISEKAFVDAIELLQLIEVMKGQNKDPVNAKLSEAGAAGAAMVVRNAVLSRIVLFIAGAYAPSRPNDLHLRRAFDLLDRPGVRTEVGLMASAPILDNAVILWARCKGDHRLRPIKHFRDKYTAHSSKPEDIPLPLYDDVFSFARDTMMVMDVLARGTGARREPLWDWEAELANSAARLWSPWGVSAVRRLGRRKLVPKRAQIKPGRASLVAATQAT